MTEAVATSLESELPPPLRVAIAYAPRAARGPWSALLGLDRRLARAALGSSEPLLGQMRLAWWRDRFATPAQAWPRGEPLLAALAAFDDEREALSALVDAWEALIGGERDARSLAALGAARAEAIIALVGIVGATPRPGVVEALAQAWTHNELGHASARVADAVRGRLPRIIRPLAIVAELASAPAGQSGWRQSLRIIRLGTLGR